jgi:hypothetical protein
MKALVGLKGAEGRDQSRVNEKIPVLRRAETQAEAGPLMLMVRRANMGASIAAGRRNRKAPPGDANIKGDG